MTELDLTIPFQFRVNLYRYRMQNNDQGGLKSYSQFGEDVDIWDYLGRSSDGVFLEAGANHPINLSQTYFFETQGWSGVLVEPVPECCDLLRAQRPRSKVFQNALGAAEQRGPLKISIPNGVTELAQAVAAGEKLGADDRVIETTIVTIDDVLKEAGVSRLDYLSLDTEGMELAAMQGLDFAKYHPRFILLEDRIESLDKHRFLVGKGYKLVNRRGVNNWYVPAEASYPVSLLTSLKLLRKLYLSMPFRWLRGVGRRLCGR